MRGGRLSGRLAALGLGCAVTLAACTQAEPGLAPGSSAPADSAPETITIGSAAFPESEIIAEIYAQALEREGIEVERRFNIGQREVYLAALEDGSIDLIPEYSGNLLLYYEPDAAATSSEDVYAALQEALPPGLEVLDQSQAQDKDSFNVTREFSEEHGVTSLADLASVDIPLKLGANPEAAERSAGLPGLQRVYGLTMTLVPINDSGGPLTVKALLDGEVHVANIFSTMPAIKDHDLVTLEDPENLIPAQNVLPLISSEDVSAEARDVLDRVSARLTTEHLIDLNTKSDTDQSSAAVLAEEWLAGGDA